MENYPFAIFTFDKKVKTFKDYLKGNLTEEKGFFEALKIPPGRTLGEVVRSSPILEELLKAFIRINRPSSKTNQPVAEADRPLATKMTLDGKSIYLEISKCSEIPYAIILSVIPEEKDAKAEEEDFTKKEGATGAKVPTTTAEEVFSAREETAIKTIFKEIIDAIPTAIAILDDKSNIVEVNNQFEKLFGWKKAEIIGKNINELIVPKDNIKDGIYLDNIVKDTGYFKVERKRVAKDGREIPVIISGSSFFLDGKQIGFAVYEDIKDIKKVQEVLYYQATHDILTGLPNRYALKDIFNIEKAHADREGNKIALFFIDINYFKDVNDTYGHDFGDKVIKKTAELILSSIRGTDTITRFGGDEFVTLFGGIRNIEDAIEVGLKIIDAFSNPFLIDETKIEIGVNIGIVFYPDNGNTLEELLRKADIAMYQAKAMGTNNFVFYSKEIEEARIRTISDLKAREVMFRLVFNKSPIPQLLLDSEFRILRANDSFKNIFKINLRKVYASRLTEIFEGSDKIVATIQNKHNEQTIMVNHVKIEGKDYNLKWTHSLIKSYSSLFYLLAILEVNSGSE